MARSTNIFIVENPEAGAVLAAFTVKHECKTWLARVEKNHFIKGWTVMRVPDGSGFEHRDVLIIPADKFLRDH